MNTRINGYTVRSALVIGLLGLSSSAHAVFVIGPVDTLNLNGTLSDDVLNQGALNVQWGINPGGYAAVITGSLDNQGVTRVIANDGGGGFFTHSPLWVEGGIQNSGTIRFETSGAFGNSGSFPSLNVTLGASLTNLSTGLIETTVHAGVGQSGNAITGQILNHGTFIHGANTTLTINNASGDLVGADHENSGTMNINAGAVSIGALHSFNNSGTIQGRGVTLTGFPNGVQPGFSAVITNSGLIDMTAGILSAYGVDSFTNTPSGQINLVGGNGGVSHFNSFVNQGGIMIGAGREFGLGGGVNAGIAENQLGGVISGHGTLHVAVGTSFVNMGTIAPGSSFGTLNVIGSIVQGASGVLDIEVGGIDPGITHDQLTMSTGSMTLGGTLRLDFQGFAPNTFDSFQFISGNVLGSFDQLELVGIQPGAQFSIDTTSGFQLTALNNWSLDCDGDANNDGAVDVNDISYVIFRLGDAGPDGDANLDGVVDVNDISFVIFRLGIPCP